MGKIKTLKANYQRNVDILKENIKRGMTVEQANEAIDGMEAQFKNANLYGQDEKDFISHMRALLPTKATDLMHAMGVSVTKIS